MHDESFLLGPFRLFFTVFFCCILHCVSASAIDDAFELAELRSDLFGHHSSRLEGFVFVAADERGEYVMSDEICRRYNGKKERRSVAAEVCSSQTV